MKNLAGVKDCDEYIRQELKLAGINIIEGVDCGKAEVPYSVIGVLGGKLPTKEETEFVQGVKFEAEIFIGLYSFVFIRAWTYWIVKGYVPLEVTEEVHANPIGQRDVRAGGHCGCLQPKTQLVRHKVAGKQVVNCYHIDSPEGLNLFVVTLKKHNLL